jgi:cold shock CspA family protein
MRGTVKRLVVDGGYGFIEGADGEEFFFNRAALLGTDFGELAPGIPVEFDIKRHEHGDQPGEDPRAVGVRLAPDAIPAVENTRLPPEKTGQAGT